ncbi:MAG TPA: hypothetical protein VLM40_07405 [Gemmata sp.]|nr:hypothetical protein [Gemmata sp.]
MWATLFEPPDLDQFDHAADLRQAASVLGQLASIADALAMAKELENRDPDAARSFRACAAHLKTKLPRWAQWNT